MSISQTKLLALINAINSAPIPATTENVELIEPVTTFGSTWNTRITMRAIPGAGLKSETFVFYRRIPLNLIGDPIPLARGSIATPQQLLTALNAVYNTWLELDELETFVVPAFVTGQDATLTLRAKASSLSWLSETPVLLQANAIVNPSINVTDASFASNYPIVSASVTGTLVANP